MIYHLLRIEVASRRMMRRIHDDANKMTMSFSRRAFDGDVE